MGGRRINAVSFNMFRLAHTGFSPGTMAKWKVEGDNAMCVGDLGVRGDRGDHVGDHCDHGLGIVPKIHPFWHRHPSLIMVITMIIMILVLGFFLEAG